MRSSKLSENSSRHHRDSERLPPDIPSSRRYIIEMEDDDLVQTDPDLQYDPQPKHPIGDSWNDEKAGSTSHTNVSSHKVAHHSLTLSHPVLIDHPSSLTQPHLLDIQQV
jgi:hypothetical protein